MSTGGIFTIIANDGKQDRLLMATSFLHNRLKAINDAKRQQNPSDYSADHIDNLPTLLDIEQTHILFMNAHFKPFAAMGFEYHKVNTNAGSPSLGHPVQFSIPQFGDFFHDICCHVVLRQPTLTETATNPADEPLMRWAHFPGERLLKSVSQEVNSNLLDSYTYHATNMYREFRVAPNKKLSWYRCVGQEVPEEGFVDQPNWENSAVSSSDINHRLAVNVHVGNQTPTGQVSNDDANDVKSTYARGNIEMFIPLLFWYNKDVRLAVPSVAIPYGQRWINIELASLEELVGLYPRGTGTFSSPNGTLTEHSSTTISVLELYVNNIFVNPEVHKIYIKRIGFTLIRVHRQQLYTSNQTTESLLLQQLKWPIEFLFIGLKIKEYHASSSSSAVKREHLDKWHTFHKRTTGSYKTLGQTLYREEKLVDTSAGTEQLGLTVSTANTTTGALNAAALTTSTNAGETATLLKALSVGDVIKVAGMVLTVSTASNGTAVLDANNGNAPYITVYETVASAVSNSTTVASEARLLVPQGLAVTTAKPVKTMNNIGIKAHGISIYPQRSEGFYNSYLPYHYGGPNISSPSDCGAYFVPFCLYPGTYQPSGHINVSRAREFYLEWDSSVINSNTEGTLVVIASAINFLLISDGSAVLRYST